MKFDRISVKNLDNKTKQKMLLKSGMIFDIIGIALLIFGLILLLFNNKILGIVILIVSIIPIILGIKNLFLRSEKRDKYLMSKLVRDLIKSEKRNGKYLTKEEIKKIRFKYDPIFHNKIVLQVHRKQDKEYNINVKNAENKVKGLKTARINEINRINNERWQSVANDRLMYNLVEGKININKTIYLFSSIKGAEIKKDESYRVVTISKGKSKKHVSLGKAVVGGALLGPVGAIAGGAMGKTTTIGNSVSNSIPTCNHIGVIVDIDGFKSEIIVLNKTVDQASSAYKNALQNAEEIVSKLNYLSKQPVPKNFIKVENEKTVLDIEKSIVQAQKTLEKTKNNKPTYDIPDMYLSKE